MLNLDNKRCPYCSEEILADAKKCKHCGEWLDDSSRFRQNQSYNYSIPTTSVKLALSNKYELLNKIGEGGMAVVYKARQKNLDRIVALKVIHQNLINDQEYLERFHAEARLAASLNHPNIVSIYDEGSENGAHYIAMEYLEGEDLHKRIKMKGKLSIDETVRLIAAIAEALDYIHRKGLVHRDIKTPNIIITPEGRAILTDFGIARSVNDSKFSQAGTIIGTPEYMSPEQADGFEVNPGSDLYSLGVVLYECLTGVVPFNGENPSDTINKIINTPHLPVTMINNKVPDWLQSITNKALNKNPQYRFHTGREFAFALREKKNFKTSEIETQPRTQKLNKEDFNKIASSNNKYPTKKSSELSERYSSGRKKAKNKLPYFIGISIIILILSISYLMYPNFFNRSENLVNLMNDNNWTALNESQKKQILNLAETGEVLMEKENLLMPKENNAYDNFNTIIKIHPTNRFAIKKLNEIFNNIYKKSKTDLASGKVENGMELVNLLKQYFPEKEAEINNLLISNQSTLELNQIGDKLKTDNLSSEDISSLYSNLKSILISDPQNKTANDLNNQLREKILKISESNYANKNWRDALISFRQFEEFFGQSDLSTQRINESLRRIEFESLIEIPNTEGFSESEAKNMLTNSGFKVMVVYISTAGEKGKVISQSPKNKKLNRGNNIMLKVIN